MVSFAIVVAPFIYNHLALCPFRRRPAEVNFLETRHWGSRSVMRIHSQSRPLACSATHCRVCNCSSGTEKVQTYISVTAQEQVPALRQFRFPAERMFRYNHLEVFNVGDFVCDQKASLLAYVVKHRLERRAACLPRQHVQCPINQNDVE